VDSGAGVPRWKTTTPPSADGRHQQINHIERLRRPIPTASGTSRSLLRCVRVRAWGGPLRRGARREGACRHQGAPLEDSIRRGYRHRRRVDYSRQRSLRGDRRASSGRRVRSRDTVWRPLAFQPFNMTWDINWLSAFAILKPGIHRERQQMDAIGARIARIRTPIRVGHNRRPLPTRSLVHSCVRLCWRWWRALAGWC
jgi:hypothetical protein